MLNKNEMNGKANAADVDVDLLVAGIGEMLDGIRHCLKATDLHSSSTDSGSANRWGNRRVHSARAYRGITSVSCMVFFSMWYFISTLLC